MQFSTKYVDPETTASLDRIDSQNVYVLPNLQWIHKELNQMKMDMPEDRFFYWVEKVYNHRIKPLIEQKKEEQENADYSI